MHIFLLYLCTFLAISSTSFRPLWFLAIHLLAVKDVVTSRVDYSQKPFRPLEYRRLRDYSITFLSSPAHEFNKLFEMILDSREEAYSIASASPY